MERVLFLAVALLVSPAAAGRTYDSDAGDEFLAPVQGYDEIRGKCYPEKLQRDDPDPIQYVEIVFRNKPSQGGLSFDVAHHAQSGITYVRLDQYNVEIVQFYQDTEVWWAGSRKSNFDTLMFGRLFHDRRQGIAEGNAGTNSETFVYEERVGSRREVQRKREWANYELITKCHMNGDRE